MNCDAYLLQDNWFYKMVLIRGNFPEFSGIRNVRVYGADVHQEK
jgi:hypothetical protein